MPNFIFMNLIVVLDAFFISKYFFTFNSTADYFISLFIIFLSQIILSLLALGITGTLYLRNVIILSIIILFVISTIIRLFKLKVKNRPFSKLSFPIEEFPMNKVQIVCFSVIFGFAIVKILINLVNPPFGWDSLNYHFTFPVEWLKQGNLDNPITVFDDPSPSYYPINGSLFYLWLMLPFKSVFLADLGQAPFFIIAIMSIYGISRKIGLNKSLSFYNAVLFLLIPNFFKQLEIAYVDVMVAALFLVCVDYLLLINKDFNLQNVLIYSLSLGLLIGTKTIALPYSILLIIPFMVMLFKKTKRISLILVPLFCILAWGAFTYLRNFMETGNPLYPLNFKIFGIHILKGAIDKTTYSSHFRAIDYNLAKTLFHEGLGAQSLLIILPAVFLALPVALIRKRKEINFNLTYLFIMPILIYLVYRYIIPLANLRYLYALMGIGIILGFYVLDALRVKKPFIDTLVIICVLASMPEFATRQELLASILLSLLLFFILIGFKKTKLHASFLKNRYLLAFFIAVILCFMFVTEKYYAMNEFRQYYKMVKYSGFWPDATLAWDWLNINTSGNNIAYVGRPVPFPLYGSRIKNNVYYVSVNKTEPVKLHFFKNSNYKWDSEHETLHNNLEAQGNYRGNADYETWINNMIRRDTDYLFVYSLHQTKNIIFPVEDIWAQANPGKFRRIFTNATIHIYKILK